MGNVAREVGVGPLDPVTYRWTDYKIVTERSDLWEGPNMPPGAFPVGTGTARSPIPGQ